MKACEICGTPFTPPKLNRPGRFCSARCRNAGNSRASAVKRGALLRGTGDKGWYRKLNGRHEHRVIAELVIGRPLKPGEVVHHRDHNKLNNTPANLVVMTQAEHMRLHGLGIAGQAPAHRPWEKRWPK